MTKYVSGHFIEEKPESPQIYEMMPNITNTQTPAK